jgi:hypothetical protein
MPANPPVELHDIEGAQRFLDGWWLPWWAWAAIATAGALAVLGLVALLRRPRRTRVDPNISYQAGCAALENLRTRQQLLAPAELATGISLALRRYLAEVTRDPALFETREEFVSRADALAALPAGDRAATSALFAELGALQYAPAVDARETAALLDRAALLLRQLHQSVPTLTR